MSISYSNEDKTFKLDTVNSTYLIHIVDKGFLLHGYYGRKISDHNTTYLTRIYEFPFYPAVNNRENGSFMDAAPFEYPASDRGDYRGRAIEAESLKGYRTFDMRYVSHRIYEGKPKLEGLPATFAGKDEADTLEIECLEPVLNINVTLLYSVFKNKDVITRSVIVKNNSEEAVYLTRIMSLCLDMDNEDYDLITLNGSWARERHIDRRRIHKGMTSVSSSRGESSHQEHPFLAVLDHNATNDHGSVYGFNFVYSGNFTASVNYTQFDSLRIMMGINPCDFRWKLEPCESFVSPEAVMVYSGNGLNEMTHTFHDLYRNNLIRSPYKDKKRPILINNWEATYFDFDSEKLLSIAREAGKSGIEMLVMDDGWFGTRSSDNMALGDWYVNEDKLKGGLKALVDRINEIPVAGTDKKMKFGIWVEPEMISPDSDLFREHPDYAIQIPDRDPALIRNQLVLDLSRKEVVDCIYSMISKVLKSANIEYVKWDMNRGLTDLGSCLLPGERQGELLHRYMLGVYDMQERLVNDFPDLLLENCSSGGARFDPGMLYYSPQIWCSDDTDAIERLAIQEGTALIYPLSCIGAHVSDCPNHTVFRNTPFKTRGDVALLGTFGYELDITKIPEEDRAMIPKQVEQYHKFHMLIQDGDYYRISSFRENNLYDCTEVVKKDRSEALVTFVQVLARANSHSLSLKLKGLDPKQSYLVYNEDKVLCFEGEEESMTLNGDTLMNAGLRIIPLWGRIKGDFASTLIHIKKC